MRGPGDRWEATTQDKELIGKLQVACSISIDPANKLSLMSSLITKVNAVMESRCKFYAPPSLDDILGELLLAMLWSQDGKIPKDAMDKADANLDALFKEPTTTRCYTAMECLRDMYLISQCSENWKKANEIYMTDKNAWAISNAQLHDISMVIDSIIRRNDLSSLPKNASFSTESINAWAGLKNIKTPPEEK